MTVGRVLSRYSNWTSHLSIPEQETFYLFNWYSLRKFLKLSLPCLSSGSPFFEAAKAYIKKYFHLIINLTFLWISMHSLWIYHSSECTKKEWQVPWSESCNESFLPIYLFWKIGFYFLPKLAWTKILLFYISYNTTVSCSFSTEMGSHKLFCAG
jgi:hypothetical protein